jgi:PAS domain S-box-containing protein
MALQFTVHAVPMALSALLAGIGGLVAWRRRRDQLELWGTITQFGIMWWSLLVLGMISVTTETPKVIGVILFYPVVIATTFSFLVFTVYFVGNEDWVTRRRLVALFGYASLMLVAGVTNSLHGLTYTFDGVVVDGFTQLDYAFGPLFYAIIVPAYGATLAYITLLFQHFRRSRNVYRTMSFVLLVSLFLLTVVSIPSLLQVSPLPHYMLFPYTYALLGTFLVLGTSSARFLRLLPLEHLLAVFNPEYRGDTVPTARDFVMQELDTGIVVIGADNVVVDMNATAKEMLGAGRPIGKHVSEVVPTEQILSESVTKAVMENEAMVRELTEEVWVETPRENRCYDIRVTELSEGGGGSAAHVALMHDITERKEREEELRDREEELTRQKADLQTQKAQLEHQNERLDKFAGIVSHDLRNPLNVARGRIQFTIEGLEALDDPPVDLEHPRVASNSMDRMEDIISDALTLARQGKAITETEQVALNRTVQTAWENVETKEASLDTCEPVRIQSDEDRLLNVFENLFRNAVEHGREDVQIRVGLLDDGFYVEDDGPGIPDEEKDDVLEEGYTTASGGTGFGLAIVQDVIRAHGWDVEVTDSEDGGARFEVTGVEFAWTTDELVDRFDDHLEGGDAAKLVRAAKAEAQVKGRHITRESAIDVLETIPDLEEASPLAEAAAESTLEEIHS